MVGNFVKVNNFATKKIDKFREARYFVKKVGNS